MDATGAPPMTVTERRETWDLSAHGLLVRCPTCHEWFEATDLVVAEGAADTSLGDRCPRDGTALARPLQRPPAPAPLSRREEAAGTIAIVALAGYVLFMLAWIVAAVPLFALALFFLITTGDGFLLTAWAIVSAIWLVLLKIIGPINN